MLKKVCSVLLSSVLAFSVSTRKSDAGSGDIIKLGAITAAAGVAIITNGFVFATKKGWTQFPKDMDISYSEANKWVSHIYIAGVAFYAIGELINHREIYDNNNGNSNSNDKNIAKSRSQSNGEFSLLSKYKEKTEDKK